MTVSEAVDQYVAHRRQEGLSFGNAAYLLRAFARDNVDIGFEDIDAERVKRFSMRERLSASSKHQRFLLLARFVEYWKARGRLVQLTLPKPPRCLPQTFAPHIFAKDEVRALLSAAGKMKRPTVQALTFQTLLTFLSGTGCSLRSAVAFRRGDLDLDSGCATLRRAQGQGSYTIPLNASVIAALRGYLNSPSRQKRISDRIFVTTAGEPLVIATIGSQFRSLLTQAQCARKDDIQRRPRLYDLRATFAVHRIDEWIRAGKDLDRMLPALAAYMGLIDLTTTERFLLLCPSRFRSEVDTLAAGLRPNHAESAAILPT